MKTIFGVSYKNGYFDGEARVMEFDNREDFERWLHQEQYDFRSRVEIDKKTADEISRFNTKLWQV
ncbi:hypothetical protein ACTQ54_03190 [Fundicoccus sp. Sow4_H7]|uniref:hypothetical protein n=1 Tax=Fundicoccus sp. Sow4_H7 TaxID=3438784 RepID=UPI003F929958